MLSTSRLLVALCCLLAFVPACFVRHHAAAPRTVQQSAPLLSATKDQLIQRIHDLSDPVQSFVMRADLSPSVLNPSKNVVTDYATVGADILFRKPDEIRILGKDPVLSTTIFDMVSNGNRFQVWIPSKNRFLTGSNDAPGTSQNKLENLRPSALLTSLMIYPPQSGADLSVLETDTERALYILLIIRHAQDELTLSREIYFDGHDLQIARQKTFDAAGGIVSDTRYSDWKSFDGVLFPSGIHIQRPKDNYEVQLSVVTLKVNPPVVTPEKFVLMPPEGAKIEELK
jgi:outer membrane lipoprotein-sorting protein